MKKMSEIDHQHYTASSIYAPYINNSW